jgi:hypothetical protein
LGKKEGNLVDGGELALSDFFINMVVIHGKNLKELCVYEI